MNSGKEQNSLFLSCGKGNNVIISVCPQNVERKRSNRQDQPWIHPPGKSTKNNGCSGCPYKFLKNCITLSLPGNDNGICISTPWMNSSGHQESIEATSKSYRKVSRQTNEGKGSRIRSQEQTLEEIDKLMEEQEMKRENFSKYVQEILKRMEDIGIDIPKLENKQKSLSQRNSELHKENTQNTSKQKSNLPQISKTSKIVQGKVQSNESELLEQPNLESKHLSTEGGKSKTGMNRSIESLLLRNLSKIASKSANYAQSKSKKEENAKSETSRKSLGESRQGDKINGLMKNFADDMRKTKLLIDAIYQQDEAVKSKQKEYVPAVENLYQEQLSLLEQFYRAIGTSSSNSSKVSVSTDSQQKGIGKIEKPIDGVSTNNKSNGGKEFKNSEHEQKNSIKHKTKDDISTSLEETLERICADVAKFQQKFQQIKTKFEKEQQRSSSNAHEAISQRNIYQQDDNYRPRIEKSIKIPHTSNSGEHNNKTKSISGSRNTQESREKNTINGSNPLVVSREANNLGNFNDSARNTEVPHTINNSNDSKRKSQDYRGINNPNDSKRKSHDSREIDNPNVSNNSTRNSQDSQSKNKSNNSENIPVSSNSLESHSSSDNLRLYKAKSNDYVCKTTIKQIVKRYPRIQYINKNDRPAHQMTDIHKKVDQIVYDLIPLTNQESNPENVQKEDNQRSSNRHEMDIPERENSPNNRPPNIRSEHERVSNRNMDNQEDIPLNEGASNRGQSNGRSSNQRFTDNLERDHLENERLPSRRQTQEREQNRNSMYNQGGIPSYERASVERPLNRNQNLMGNQEGNLPPNERESNERRPIKSISDNQGNRPPNEKASNRRTTHESRSNRNLMDNQEGDFPPNERARSINSLNQSQTILKRLDVDQDSIIEGDLFSNESLTDRSSSHKRRSYQNVNDIQEGDFTSNERTSDTITPNATNQTQNATRPNRNSNTNQRGNFPQDKKEPNRKLSNGRQSNPNSLDTIERDLSQNERSPDRRSAEERRLNRNLTDNQERRDFSQNERAQGSDSNVQYSRNKNRDFDRSGRNISSHESRSTQSFTPLDTMEICDCASTCRNSRHFRESMLDESNSNVQHGPNENRHSSRLQRNGNSHQSRSSQTFTPLHSMEICNCEQSCRNPRHMRQSMFEDLDSDTNKSRHSDRSRRSTDFNQPSHSQSSTPLESVECNCVGPCRNPRHFSFEEGNSIVLNDQNESKDSIRSRTNRGSYIPRSSQSLATSKKKSDQKKSESDSFIMSGRKSNRELNSNSDDESSDYNEAKPETREEQYPSDKSSSIHSENSSYQNSRELQNRQGHYKNDLAKKESESNKSRKSKKETESSSKTAKYQRDNKNTHIPKAETEGREPPEQLNISEKKQSSIKHPSSSQDKNKEISKSPNHNKPAHSSESHSKQEAQPKKRKSLTKHHSSLQQVSKKNLATSDVDGAIRPVHSSASHSKSSHGSFQYTSTPKKKDNPALKQNWNVSPIAKHRSSSQNASDEEQHSKHSSESPQHTNTAKKNDNPTEDQSLNEPPIATQQSSSEKANNEELHSKHSSESPQYTNTAKKNDNPTEKQSLNEPPIAKQQSSSQEASDEELHSKRSSESPQYTSTPKKNDNPKKKQPLNVSPIAKHPNLPSTQKASEEELHSKHSSESPQHTSTPKKNDNPKKKQPLNVSPIAKHPGFPSNQKASEEELQTSEDVQLSSSHERRPQHKNRKDKQEEK